MMVFQVWWHSFENWVIGWGGISLLIGALAIGLWYFTPPILSSTEARAILLNVGLWAVAFSFVSGYFFKSGYQSAIDGVANNTKEVRDDILAAVSSVEKCDFNRGTWNTVTGVCEQQRE